MKNNSMLRSRDDPYYSILTLIQKTQQEEKWANGRVGNSKVEALEYLKNKIETSEKPEVKLIPTYLSICCVEGRKANKKTNSRDDGERIIRFAQCFQKYPQMPKLIKNTAFWLDQEGREMNPYLLSKYGTEVGRVLGKSFTTIEHFESAADEVIQKAKIIGLYFYKGRLRNPSAGYFKKVDKIDTTEERPWIWIAKKKDKIVKFWTLPDSPTELVKNSPYYYRMFNSFFRIS